MPAFSAPLETNPLTTEAYAYALPEELVAAHPPEERGTARLMMVGMERGELRHAQFGDLGEVLRPGDLLVFNATRVLPGRLRVKKPTGGRVELLVLERADESADPWRAPVGGTATLRCMTRSSKKLRAPLELELVDHPGVFVRLVEASAGHGLVEIEAEGSLLDWFEAHGHIPLPPYILKRREALGEEAEDQDEDATRYQTVYADAPGAIAAPTAGLHFTDDQLTALRAAGVQTAEVVLHVGPGTFKPVTVEDLADHPMHHEPYVIPEGLGAQIAATKAAGGRVIAVGTTSMRTLEAEARREVPFTPGARATDLFLHPHNPPILCDGLITNFHLPCSTLLTLVAGLASYPLMREAYEEAIAERYRFYSYGDAMVLLPTLS